MDTKPLFKTAIVSRGRGPLARAEFGDKTRARAWIDQNLRAHQGLTDSIQERSDQDRSGRHRDLFLIHNLAGEETGIAGVVADFTAP